MIKTLLINEDTCYAMAEQKAIDYFQLLNQQVKQKNYIPTLTRDIQSIFTIIHYSLFFLVVKVKQIPVIIIIILNIWITRVN
jgi:hypothetical protein